MSCSTCSKRQYEMLHDVLKQEWREKRKKELFDIWDIHVKIRDKSCFICESIKDLLTIHVIPATDNSSLIYDIKNGVTVCSECYTKNVKKLLFNSSLAFMSNDIFEAKRPNTWEYLMEHRDKQLDYDDIDILLELCVPIRRFIGYWDYKKTSETKYYKGVK